MYNLVKLFFVILHLPKNQFLKKEEEENKKDNPKEIFYDFLKLFRKQKSKRKTFLLLLRFFKSLEEIRSKTIFLEKWLFKMRPTHTQFKFFSKSDFNQKTVTIFILF
jgi:hypothetical protein